MQPTAQNYLSSTPGNTAASGLEENKESLIDSLKPISRLVTTFNNKKGSFRVTDCSAMKIGQRP